MKHLINLTTFTFIILTLFSCQQKDSYQLVWSDEFEYEGLPDANKWSYDTRGNSWGWGNNELQYYTVEKIENAQVSNGTLKIHALKDSVDGKAYTSARLITQNKGDWKYGRFEISAKLPDGLGAWPAIWMMPTESKYGRWPKSGEIDIMENVGYDPDTIWSTVHTGAYNHNIGTHLNGAISIPDNRDEFHVYAVEWQETTIKGFVDDTCYFTFEKRSDNSDEWPFDQKFYLILNIAVGGNWGGTMGVDDSIFPTTMEVDYVRVYQKTE